MLKACLAIEGTSGFCRNGRAHTEILGERATSDSRRHHALPNEALISLIIPVHDTTLDGLWASGTSIKAQIYRGADLVFSNEDKINGEPSGASLASSQIGIRR
jgi:hypothetical protein